MEPDELGTAVADETGSMAPLRKYSNKTVVLSLPDGVDVTGIDWLSIWSSGLKRSLAHVEIPAMTINVPPAPENLGVTPQVRPFVLATEVQLLQRLLIVEYVGS